MRVGGMDYRYGARDRPADAWLLLDQGRFSGGVYLAGRAVEGMLRSLIWHSDHEYATGKKSLGTGHNLRELLSLACNLEALRQSVDFQKIQTDVQTISRLWWNNLRFRPDSKLSAQWYSIGVVGKRRSLKAASREFYGACSTIIKRCEVIWDAHQRLRK